MNKKEKIQAELLAAKIRSDILSTLMHRGYGHMGGSLSIADLLAVLYSKQLNFCAQNPHWEGRDRLVLSKGHAGPALYSALAESGFFDRDLLFTLNDSHTLLPSHPDRTKTPGVDMTTGSLGQGTSTAAGIATALKKKGSACYTYLIVGDGELNEGQCWEAFQYLANYRLNRCIVIIDDNKKQLDGLTKEVMNPFDIQKKMEAFGFWTTKVKGKDIEGIDRAICEAKQVSDQAVCIVLDSVKGAGVPYFETMVANHAVKFNNDEIKQKTSEAIAELKDSILTLEKELDELEGEVRS